MRVVIFAGKPIAKLSMLTGDLPIGAINLADKSLCSHLIGQLKPVSQNIFLHLNNKGREYQEYIYDLFDIQTGLSKLDMTEDEKFEEALWLRDDVLYNLDFNALISEFRQSADDCISLCLNEIPVMFYSKAKDSLRRPEKFTEEMTTADYSIVVMQWFFCQVEKGGLHKKIHLTDDQAVIIDSPKKFHSAALSVLRNEYPFIKISHPIDSNGSITLGWHDRVEKESLLQNHGYIGDCVFIDKTSRLSGDVLIGGGCYIDRFVNIKNTIVMPDVYIGEHLNLENSIVTDTCILNVLEDITMPVINNAIKKTNVSIYSHHPIHRSHKKFNKRQ